MSIGRWLLLLLALVPAAFAAPAQAQDDQQYYVVVYVEFLPPYADKGARNLEQLARLARTAPGSVSFGVNEEVGRPNFFSLVERWTDADSYQKFIGSDRAQGVLHAMQHLLEAPLDERDGTLIE